MGVGSIETSAFVASKEKKLTAARKRRRALPDSSEQQGRNRRRALPDLSEPKDHTRRPLFELERREGRGGGPCHGHHP
jgi:hypothetical protein